MERYILVFLFLIYGSFSSPTPDIIGWAEITCALCLIFLSHTSIKQITTKGPTQTQRPYLHFIAYALLGGLIMMAVNPVPAINNWHSIIVKDMIATLFLALPLFIKTQNHDDNGFAQCFLYGCLFVGTAFSLRFLSGLWGGDHIALSAVLEAALYQNHTLNADQLYLANSPLVIFTALYSLFAIILNLRQKTPKLSVILLYSLSLILSTAAIGLMLQRLTALMLLILFIGLLIWLAQKRPLRAALISAIGIGFIALYTPVLNGLIQPFIEKTWRSGYNMRAEEWQAVLSTLSTNPLTALFGLGLGGSFDAPTVGGMNVGYTHSLLSALLLKFGLCGLALFIVVIIGITRQQQARLRPSLAPNISLFSIVLWMVFLIGCFFYANYKSFGFGCIIWMLANTTQMTHKHRDEHEKPVT